MQKITVARALSELKSLDARIEKAIQNANFVDVWQNKQDLALRATVKKEDFNVAAKASVQSVEALIKRRNDIKEAIAVSNATTRFKIAGEEYTVIGAIERKNSIKYDKLYLSTMRKQLAECKMNMENSRQHSEKAVNAMVEASFGQGVKPSPEDYKNISEPYLHTHELHLLDPCNIEKKITELDDKIDEFLKEIDICLTESNSRTEIEVSE